MATFEDSEEAKNAIYDRQIRLWGAAAQKKIGDSKVLFLGLGCVNVELCKNLVLAGFSATLGDGGVVGAADLAYNFLVEEGDVGRNVAEASARAVGELNPFAAVGHVASGVEAASTAERAAALVAGHGVVVAERSGRGAGRLDDCLARLDDACRAAGAVFVAVRCGADGGLAFLDLGPRHEYVVETGTGDRRKVSEPRVAAFCTYAEMRAVPWSEALPPKAKTPPPQYVHDRVEAAWAARDGDGAGEPPSKRARGGGAGDDDDAAYVAFAEAELGRRGVPFDEAAVRRSRVAARAPLAPVAAVLGGILGQEVVKAVSGKGAPTNNLFAFDAATGAGVAFSCNPNAAAAPAAAAAVAPPPAEAIEL